MKLTIANANGVSKPFQILLVEDNEGDVLLTSDALEECGYPMEITVARNGEEAIDFLFTQLPEGCVPIPDMVFLDINIPIYNGHEVLQRIRENSQTQNLFVVMLTTSDNETDKLEAEKNNANRYLKKPVDLQEHHDLVSAFIEIFKSFKDS